MKRKTRQEELIEKIKQRLSVLEKLMLLPPDDMSNAEFEEIRAEAVKLRDVLKML
jgi:hypothetical protein